MHRSFMVRRNQSPRTQFEHDHPVEIIGLGIDGQKFCMTDDEARRLAQSLANVADHWASTSVTITAGGTRLPSEKD